MFILGIPLSVEKGVWGGVDPEKIKTEQSDGFRTVTQTLVDRLFILVAEILNFIFH